MKTNTLLLLSGIMILLSCSKEDYYPFPYSNESTIYSESDDTRFREFLIILKPYIEVNNEKKYLVTDTILNVGININGKDWGKFSSFDIDTSLFIKETENKYKVTSDIIKYSVIAPYQTSKDILTMAGEYSDMLNNYLILEPGFYICEIKSFEIKLNDGSKRKIDTFIVELIEIKENSRSTFVGEFEILIK